MKLVILGATGGIGLEIVQQAVELGHSVTAFVRSPERLKIFDNRINLIKGDLLNRSELESVIKGHDAVLSAFGPRAVGERARGQFATALTKAMVHTGVRRVVAVSVAFLFKDSIVPLGFILGRLFFGNTVPDSFEMENTIIRSGLNWTIVRPPRLTDKPPTRKYRVQDGHLPSFGFKISRADVADFMLKTIENESTFGKIIGVCD